MKKDQPKIKLPGLPVPQQQGTKILSTPAAISAATYQPAWESAKRNPDGTPKFQEGSKHHLLPRTTAGRASGFVGTKRGKTKEQRAAEPRRAFVFGDISPKRIDPIVAHEDMHQLFSAIGQKYGEHVRRGAVNRILDSADKSAKRAIRRALMDLGYEGNDRNFGEETLAYFHTYMTDPANRARIQKRVPVSYRPVIDHMIKRSWRKMLRVAAGLTPRDFEEPVSKAIDPKSFNRVLRSHVPSSGAVADHTGHMEVSEPSHLWQAAINDPKKMKPLKAPGISAKLAVSPTSPTGEKLGTVMVKPYHKKLESHTKGYVTLPITGWSTMATKGLYNAGGIGHLAEDVRTGEHQGVPLTVHHFAEGYEPVSEHIQWRTRYPAKPTIRGGVAYSEPTGPKSSGAYVNPLSASQVGLMDYLTGNSDRHTGNLMVNRGAYDEHGYNPLLAIDHERSFQYRKPPGFVRREGTDPRVMSQDHPSQYAGSQNPALGIMSKLDRQEHSHALADWWHQNKDNVRREMDKQLMYLKDPKIREHVASNFNKRYDHVSNWAQGHVEGRHSEDFFDPANSVPWTGMSSFPERHTEQVEKVLSNLPKDPHQAAEHILSGKVNASSRVVKEALARLTENLSPEQLGDLLVRHHAGRDRGYPDVRHMVRSKRFANREDADRFVSHVRQLLDRDPQNAPRFPFLGRIRRAYQGTEAA